MVFVVNQKRRACFSSSVSESESVSSDYEPESGVSGFGTLFPLRSRWRVALEPQRTVDDNELVVVVQLGFVEHVPDTVRALTNGPVHRSDAPMRSVHAHGVRNRVKDAHLGFVALYVQSRDVGDNIGRQADRVGTSCRRLEPGLVADCCTPNPESRLKNDLKGRSILRNKKCQWSMHLSYISEFQS